MKRRFTGRDVRVRDLWQSHLTYVQATNDMNIYCTVRSEKRSFRAIRENPFPWETTTSFKRPILSLLNGQHLGIDATHIDEFDNIFIASLACYCL